MTVTGRGLSALFVSLALLAASAGVTLAACTSPQCPNDTIVEPVRQMIAASCDCAGVSSHKQYLRCAKEVMKGAIRAQTLPAECKRTVRRCEARSTCGRIKSAAVCCVPKRQGRIKALVTKNENRCRGTLCEGPLAAADACRADGTCAVKLS